MKPPFHFHQHYVIKELSALTILVVLATISLQAQNIDKHWDYGGANQNWSNPLNWSGNALPATGTGDNGDNLHFNTPLGTHAIYTATQGTNIYRSIRIGDFTNNAVLEATGGRLTSDGTTQTRIATGGRTATFNQNGGTVSFGGHMQVGGDANSIGNVNLSGGTLISARNGTIGGITLVSMALGDGNNAQGNFTLSGGEFRTRTGVLLGNPATTGTGRFEVRGGGTARIGIENTGDDGFWIQHAGSTLAAYVTGGTLGTILIEDLGSAASSTNNDGNVFFAAGSLLEVGFMGVTNFGEWDLMQWEGTLTDGGLAFAPSVTDSNWSFAFVDTGGATGPDTLRIRYGSFADVPVGLTATPGNSNVLLNWNTSSNATSFNVKRGASTGGPYTLITNVVTNGFTDTGLSNGTTYYYVVSSVTTTGESLDSAEVEATPTTFIHPGGLFKKSDMERMRFMVQAGVDPWFTSFQQLKSQSQASFNYSVRGDPTWTTVSRDPPSTHKTEYESDVTAAWLNALMWIVAQDTRHADKCVEIFNTWKNLKDVRGGGTEALNGGLYAWKFVEAAEIIKSTYSGWSPSDIQQFKDMLVYPGYSSASVPSSVNSTNGTYYWRIYRGDPGRHGNQDLIAWRAMIVMGVFLDNQKMYDRASRYFKGLPGRTDDIPMPTGPKPSGAQIADNEFFTTYQQGSAGFTPDYGYNGVLKYYVWENGQNQESSRDQQHAFFGMGICAGIADVAWNQGDDIWNSFTNRIMEGFEFMSKYNTTFIASFPDQPTPWEPTNFIQRLDRTGRWFSKKINPHFESDFVGVSRGDFPGKRPVYEQAVAHFDVRMGLSDDAIWTIRGRDVAVAESGYEVTGWSLDHPGWGALIFRRPPLCAGDPISGFLSGRPVFEIHKLPGIVQAENYDYFPTNGDGRTYHDLSPANSGGQYRNDGVDIAFDPIEGHYLTDLASGEWTTYTVNVPGSGNYSIAARCAALTGNGMLRFAFGTNDVTGEISLPATGGTSSWSTRTVAESVSLSAGVQAMRVNIGGASNVFNLNSIIVTPVLGHSLSGNGMRFSWPSNLAGWRLEAQTNSLTTGISSSIWYTAADAGVTNQLILPINPANGSVFFRLALP